MAKVTKQWDAPRGVKVGQAFIHDSERPEYLDGAQMRYSVDQRVKGEKFHRTLAYFDTLEDAQLFADAKNALVQS